MPTSSSSKQTAGPFEPTWRCIPSRFPPIDTFEDVASPDDLEAVLELEGWTNDSRVRYRLEALPQEQWVIGRPNASVVMAAFLHGSPLGSRFASGTIGAWYAALAERTALVEIAHHLRREVIHAGQAEITSQYRSYQARLIGNYADLREVHAPDLYDPESYDAGQAYGAALRARGEHRGIVYRSVRHREGTNVVCFHPPSVEDVRQTTHWDVTVPLSGRIICQRLDGRP